MAKTRALAQLHQDLKPDRLGQKLLLVLLCFACVSPAMQRSGFRGFLPDWPWGGYLILSCLVGAFVGFFYHPKWRYGLVGVLPGMLAGPIVMSLTAWYTSGRQTVYRSEMALVWVAGLAPAALLYYLALRLVVMFFAEDDEELSPPVQPARRGAAATMDRPTAAAAKAEPRNVAPPPHTRPEKKSWSKSWAITGLAVVVLLIAMSMMPRKQPGPPPVGTAPPVATVPPVTTAAPVLPQPTPPPASPPPIDAQPTPPATAFAPRPPLVPPSLPPQPKPTQSPELARVEPSAPVTPAIKPPPPTVAPAPAATGDLARLVVDLGSADKRAQRTALSELQKRSPSGPEREQVAAAIAALLTSDDFVIRRGAAQALGTWATPASVPALLTALQGDDFPQRKQILEVLGKLQDPQAAVPIVARLSVGADRSAAAAALRALGPSAEPAVLSALDQSELFVRVEACRILEDIGTAASVSKLEAAAKDKNGLVSGAARAALQAIAARK